MCVCIYNLISLIHVSASFTPSSGSSTPTFKTHQNMIYCKSNSQYITVFLQQM